MRPRAGQLGAVLAGWPLERLASIYGWQSVGTINAVSALLATGIFANIWSLEAPEGGVPDVPAWPTKKGVKGGAVAQ